MNAYGIAHYEAQKMTSKERGALKDRHNCDDLYCTSSVV